VTTFAYDAAGQLLQRTNPRENAGELAAGHGTAILVYDTALPDLVAQMQSEVYNASSGERLLTDVSYPSSAAQCPAPAVVMPPQAGLPSLVMDPNGVVAERCYDHFGRLVSETEKQAGALVGKTTVSYLDTPSWPATPPSVTVTRYLDASRTRVATQKLDAFGRPTLASTTGPGTTPGTSTIQVSSGYDALGRMDESSLPGFEAPGPLTSIAYDVLDREIARTLPGGRTWTTGFSLASNLLVAEVTDPETGRRRQLSDAFGEVREVKELDGSSTFTTQYLYNAAGELTRITDAESNATIFGLDDLGRQVALEDPDSGDWSFGFDANGNLLSQVGPRSNDAITWTYDALDRPKTQTASGGNFTWAYDGATTPNGKGRLFTESGPYVHEIQAYDAHGNPIDEQFRFLSKSLDFATAFDWLGQQTSRTYPNGRRVDWNRNNAGFVTSVSTPASGGGTEEYAASVQWTDPQLRYASWTAGNGIPTSYAVDPATQRLAQFQVGSGGSLLSQVYGYYDDDQLETIGGSQSFGFAYDGLDRLVSASGPYAWGGSDYAQATLQYQYDPVGNLLCMDAASLSGCTGGRVFAWTAQNPGLPHAPGTIDGVPVTYDEAGNLTAYNGRTYAFNGLGQLAEVKQGTTSLGTMSYRGDGRAFKITAGGVARYRVTDDFEWNSVSALARIHVTLGGQIVAIHEEPYVPPGGGCGSVLPGAVPDLPGPGNFVLLLGWGMSAWLALQLLHAAQRRPRRVALRAGIALGTGSVFVVVVSVPAAWVPTPAQAVSPSNVTYFHADRIGSTAVQSTATGATARAYYKPFGEIVPDGQATPLVPERGFTGQRHEPDLGLYDYNARWYEPRLGRFLQADPLIGDVFDPRSLNPFSYVANDPVNRVDPTGMLDVTFCSICGPGAGPAGLTLHLTISGGGNSIGGAVGGGGTGLSTFGGFGNGSLCFMPGPGCGGSGGSGWGRSSGMGFLPIPAGAAAAAPWLIPTFEALVAVALTVAVGGTIYVAVNRGDISYSVPTITITLPRLDTVWAESTEAGESEPTPEVGEGAKSEEEYRKHVDNLDEAIKEHGELVKDLGNAKGPKRRDPILEEIAKKAKDIEGHIKEIKQKWKVDLSNRIPKSPAR
jgi:RHS repeat-associated protein